MDDYDEIIPEFEAKYDTGADSGRTSAADNASERAVSGRYSVQIARAYPIVKELFRNGVRGDTFLVRWQGLECILKFLASDTVVSEELIRNAKQLSEKMHDSVMRIHDYGFDENTKRWYLVREHARYGTLMDLAGVGRDPRSLDLAIKMTVENLKNLHSNNILHLNLKPENILVRGKQPFQVALADLCIHSLTGTAQMKKKVPVTGTSHYNAPELLKGTAGPAADYWSLGAVLFELLTGKGLYDHMPAGDIRHEGGISIPGNITEEYMKFLQGTLTGDPEKRWGYNEIRKWYEKDTNISVHFTDEPGTQRMGISARHSVPYRFLDREYCSLPEMIPAIVKSEEAWETAKTHLFEGRISEWAMGNLDDDICSQIDFIRDHSAGDPQLALVSFVYTFSKDLPFVLYGEQITCESLHKYTGRHIKHEASDKEGAIVKALLNGKLGEYYGEYLTLASKEKDELMRVLDAVRKAVSGKEDNDDKLTSAFRLMDVIVDPSKYMLPSKLHDTDRISIDFIAGIIDAVVTRDEYQKLMDGLIIPQELMDEVSKDLSTGSHSDYVQAMDKLRDSTLLKRTEFDRLQQEYIIPVWLEEGIFGSKTHEYMKAVDRLSELRTEELVIRKEDFLEYLRKYYRFIGYIIDKNSVVQLNQKGETFEQKWLRLLKRDISSDDYINLARFIKNRVALSMISQVKEIADKVSAQTANSDSVLGVIRYLEALRSGEVKWDDTDRQIVSEAHSLANKKSAFLKFLENVTGGQSGKLLKKCIGTAFGIDPDEQTKETESALVGVVGGSCLGLLVWITIAVLELDIIFYVPVVFGLLTGAVRMSIPLALLCASAGFAGAYFLELGTLITVVYAFGAAMIGGARVGAYFGKKASRSSFSEDLFKKYNIRMNEVISSIPAPRDS